MKYTVQREKIRAALVSKAFDIIKKTKSHQRLKRLQAMKEKTLIVDYHTKRVYLDKSIKKEIKYFSASTTGYLLEKERE